MYVSLESIWCLCKLLNIRIAIPSKWQYMMKVLPIPYVVIPSSYWIRFLSHLEVRYNPNNCKSTFLPQPWLGGIPSAAHYSFTLLFHVSPNHVRLQCSFVCKITIIITIQLPQWKRFAKSPLVDTFLPVHMSNRPTLTAIVLHVIQYMEKNRNCSVQIEQRADECSSNTW